jgi:hypothetical protein
MKAERFPIGFDARGGEARGIEQKVEKPLDKFVPVLYLNI